VHRIADLGIAHHDQRIADLHHRRRVRPILSICLEQPVSRIRRTGGGHELRSSSDGMPALGTWRGSLLVPDFDFIAVGILHIHKRIPGSKFASP
jgi:hypothetical protein